MPIQDARRFCRGVEVSARDVIIMIIATSASARVLFFLRSHITTIIAILLYDNGARCVLYYYTRYTFYVRIYILYEYYFTILLRKRTYDERPYNIVVHYNRIIESTIGLSRFIYRIYCIPLWRRKWSQRWMTLLRTNSRWPRYLTQGSGND